MLSLGYEIYLSNVDLPIPKGFEGDDKVVVKVSVTTTLAPLRKLAFPFSHDVIYSEERKNAITLGLVSGSSELEDLLAPEATEIFAYYDNRKSL